MWLTRTSGARPLTLDRTSASARASGSRDGGDAPGARDTTASALLAVLRPSAGPRTLPAVAPVSGSSAKGARRSAALKHRFHGVIP